jgi:hypothetical protein
MRKKSENEKLRKRRLKRPFGVFKMRLKKKKKKEKEN